MSRPLTVPIGLQMRQVTKTVSAAFDEALGQAGGSLPVWLVLISVVSGGQASQRQLAESVGVRDATLTHHLNAMEAAGLLTRRRDPANRRVHIVELTADGQALFARLREAAAAFDQRLRSGLSEADLTALTGLLNRLRDNVA
jgi:MarR family transcriptional regulator for hemolysin